MNAWHGWIWAAVCAAGLSLDPLAAHETAAGGAAFDQGAPPVGQILQRARDLSAGQTGAEKTREVAPVVFPSCDETLKAIHSLKDVELLTCRPVFLGDGLCNNPSGIYDLYPAGSVRRQVEKMASRIQESCHAGDLTRTAMLIRSIIPDRSHDGGLRVKRGDYYIKHHVDNRLRSALLNLPTGCQEEYIPDRFYNGPEKNPFCQCNLRYDSAPSPDRLAVDLSACLRDWGSRHGVGTYLKVEGKGIEVWLEGGYHPSVLEAVSVLSRLLNSYSSATQELYGTRIIIKPFLKL